MDEAVEQFQERLHTVIETEGATVVEPASLSIPMSEDTFRGSTPIMAAPMLTPIVTKEALPSSNQQRQPKGWLLLLAGAIVGLVLATLIYLCCRGKPEGGQARSGRRHATRSVASEEYSDDDEEEDTEAAEEAERPPVIVATKPTTAARRPAAKRAARATTTGRGGEAERGNDDPMFQPL